MADIRNFLTSQRDKTRDFLQASKGKSNTETREMEQRLLKPEAIPPYTGHEPSEEALDPLSAQSVLIVFPSKEDTARFRRHFAVSKMIRPSVGQPNLLVDFLQALDNGWLTYDKKRRCFTARSRRSVTNNETNGQGDNGE